MNSRELKVDYIYKVVTIDENVHFVHVTEVSEDRYVGVRAKNKTLIWSTGHKENMMENTNYISIEELCHESMFKKLYPEEFI